jgi:hypothetical protein
MGYIDNSLNEIIGIDGIEENSLYMITAGMI